MKVLVTQGPVAGSKFSMEGSILVGRSGATDIQIEDPSMSFVHCRFDIDPYEAYLIDLGSTNGSWINGRRVLRQRLQEGDLVQLGDTEIEILSLADGWYPEVDEPDESDGVPGEIFDQVGYTLNRKIADGGMGAIYEGCQYGAEGFVRKVAIKTVLPAYANRSDFAAGLAHEAKMAADLVHPNIVQIYHLGRYAGGYYIAMEYIEGITLGAFIGYHLQLGQAVPVIWALYLVGSVARALDYAQRHIGPDGKPLLLVHRDLSPNNIMIDREGVVKLTDFGVAKVEQQEAEESREIVGCVEFMSPEQAACEPVDGRSDIYALGLILFELLTGKRVFRYDDEDLERMLDVVIEGDIPHPRDYAPELPDEICVMVGKMLRRNPEDRYRDAAMVSDVCDAHLRLCGCLLSPGDLAAYVAELSAAVEEEAEEPDGGETFYSGG